MFNLKNLFINRSKCDNTSSSKNYEQITEKERENNKLYQKIMAYIDKNKDRDFDDEFISDMQSIDEADEYLIIKFGIITIEKTRFSYNIEVNGYSIMKDMPRRLSKEICNIITYLHDNALAKQHAKLLKETLAKLDDELKEK